MGMTLSNMREHETRYITLWCALPCGHHVDLCVDHLDGDVDVRSLGKGYRCSKCGRPDPESRPAWHRKDGKPLGIA